MARNRSRSRVEVAIMNCIGNRPSLFLQRIYSENSPQNCGATTPSPVRPPHRFFPRVITHCRLYCPPSVRVRIRR
jgi:hypothetical protein